jgi:MFS family permease
MPNKAGKGLAIKNIGFRSIFSRLLPLFVLAHFSHHLLTALPVPLLPLIREEFTLDYTRSGLLISAFNLSYGLGQLPAGWLADRIGPRILITIGICGVAVGGLLVGLSQTYIMITVFLVLMGVLGGGYHPSSPPIISASVEPKNRGRALGLHMIGGSASFFLAPLIAAAIATVWNWRGSFITLAVPTFIFGIVFYILLGRLTGTKKMERMIISTHKETSPTTLRSRHLVSFMILTTFTGAVFISAVSFIPLFMVDHFGIGEEEAAALIAVIFSAGLWASPLGGYLSDRLGMVAVILTVCFIAGPVIYLLNLVPYGLGFGILLIIIGMLMYIRYPVSEAYIVGQTSEHRSTILGIYYFGSMEVGGILTPVLGYLIDHHGFYISFSIAGAALLACTLVCAIFLWRNED